MEVRPRPRAPEATWRRTLLGPLPVLHRVVLGASAPSSVCIGVGAWLGLMPDSR